MIARVVIALVVIVAPAHADDAPDLVRQAKESVHELRYEEGLRLAERAWRSGGADAQQLRALFAIAGEAAGSMGDDDAARLWFSRWLALEPQAQLPAGTSPKLTGLFEKARAALGGRSLDATATRGAEAITLEIKRDPLSLVTNARVDGERVAIDAGRATVPRSARVIELVDRWGNVIVDLSIADANEQIVIEPRPGPTASRPIIARASTWAIVAGGLALGGGGAVWVALDARSTVRDFNAESGNHEFSEAKAYDDRFHTAQWVARFAFGASTVAAVASVILWQRSEHVVVAPGASGGGTVSWVQSF